MAAIPRTKKIVYGIFGTLVILAGIFWTLGYAIWTIDDFRSPEVSFGQALLGVAISWTLSLGAFYMGYRYLRELFSR
jgi:hypothetical protein